MIGKRIRYLNRYRNIAMAMMSQGFGYLVEEIGLLQKAPFSQKIFPKFANRTSKSLGERIRLVLEALGPTYIKLGQIASTRQDLFPPEILSELEKLQDKAPSFPFEQVREIIQQELGANLETIFRQFDPIPLAAASIGQVHQAVLMSGEKVAVKIQRPAIAFTIETDLEILYNLVGLMEKRIRWAENYQVTDMFDKFSKSLRNELDYTIEARNAKRISKQFPTHSPFYIPKVYDDYSTQKVLTTEYIDGIKINEVEKLIKQGYLPHVLAENLVKGMLQQIFRDGFFHGDPHPGNVVVLSKETIGLLDFGMVGRLSPRMRYHLSSLIIALMQQSSDAIVKVILAMGMAPDEVNLLQLNEDVEELQAHYYEVPMSRWGLGEVIRDIATIVWKHHIKFPADLTLVGKTLVTIEGIANKLDPGLSLMRIAEPLGRQLLLERLHPKHWLSAIWKNATDFQEALSIFPKQIKEISSFIKRGRLRLEVSIAEMEIFLKTEARIVNRLSLCIVLLSFCIIISGVIISLSFGGQSSALQNPVVELGFAVVFLMFLWLFYAILRSGGL